MSELLPDTGVSEMRILIVEDNPGDAELIEAYLEEVNDVRWQVDHVSCIVDAQAELLRAAADIVLLDMNLPDSTGLSGLKKLRNMCDVSTTFIVLTGLDNQDMAVDAIQHGAQDYLVKTGLTPAVLMRSIHYAVERQQLHKKMLQTQLQAERATEMMNRCIENADVGIWDYNLHRNEMYLSRHWKKMLGYEDHHVETTEAWWLSLVHPDDLDLVLGAIEAHVQQRTTGYHTEHRLLHRDGHWVWVFSSGAMTWGEHGEPLYRSGTTVDISDRKRLEEVLNDTLLKLRQQVKLKDMFLVNISHDIRTPMNAVLGFTELMLNHLYQGRMDKQLFRQHLEVIQSSGQLLNGLLTDLLEFSRLQSGDVTITKKNFPLWEMIETSTLLFYQQANEKGLTFDLCIDPALPMYMNHDGDRLRRVLYNLVSNAVKYTQEGHVCIRAELQDKVLNISVEDTGPGIDDTIKDILFQPFERNIEHEQLDGFGLGLPICQGLVALMGGELELKDRQGGGCIFSILLPLHKQALSAQLSAHQQVLCVSDDDRCAKRVHQAVELWGGSCQVVTVMPENTAKFDAVVVDARGSDEAGFDVGMVASLKPSTTRLAMIQHLFGDTMSQGTQSEEDWNQITALTWPLRLSELHQFLESREHDQHPSSSISAMHIPAEILVVEDNAINRQVVGGMLNQMGVRYVFAIDGEEALAAYREKPYPLVLLDLNLPDITGKSVAQGIRAMEREHWGYSYIVALTADARPEIRSEIPQLNEFLTKPISSEQLYKALQSWQHRFTSIEHQQFMEVLKMLGSQEAMRAFVQEGFKQLREIPLTLQVFRLEQSYPEMFDAAHTLKGTASYLGALRLTDLCERLCVLTDDKLVEFNHREIEIIMGKLEDEVSRVKHGLHMEAFCELEAG